MKEYLKENIDFNTLLFSTFVTLITLLIGGTFSLWIADSVSYKLKIAIGFACLLILITFIILLIGVTGKIFNDLKKLQNYEWREFYTGICYFYRSMSIDNGLGYDFYGQESIQDLDVLMHWMAFYII